MDAEVLNVTQRRQAIQRGLAHYFQGTSLEKVIGYWEQEYSEKPAFVLNRFLSDICTTDELKRNRKDMLKDVLHELTNLEKSEILHLDVHPDEQVDSFDLKMAYQDFIVHVLHAVQVSDRDDLFMELRQKLIREGIVEADSVLSMKDSYTMLDRIQTALASQVITALYSVYCDFYGPQKADRVYAQGKNDIKLKYPEIDLHRLL